MSSSIFKHPEDAPQDLLMSPNVSVDFAKLNHNQQSSKMFPASRRGHVSGKPPLHPLKAPSSSFSTPHLPLDRHRADSTPSPCPDIVPPYRSIKSLLLYSLRSFGKAFGLGYSIRTIFTLVLRIIKVLRTKPSQLFDIDGLFSEDVFKVRADAVRLGLFFGAFSGLFDFTYSLLGHLRGKNDGYNASIAGAVAGLSIVFQRADTRRTLALYVLARVLQSCYNHLKHRGVISPLPHGDAMLFSISSGIVMYCYCLKPDALPPAFYKFIVRAGPIHPTILHAVRRVTWDLPFDTENMKNYVRKNLGKGHRFILGRNKVVHNDKVNALIEAPKHIWKNAQMSASTLGRVVSQTPALQEGGLVDVLGSTVAQSTNTAEYGHRIAQSMGICPAKPVADQIIAGPTSSLVPFVNVALGVSEATVTAANAKLPEHGKSTAGPIWSWAIDKLKERTKAIDEHIKLTSPAVDILANSTNLSPALTKTATAAMKGVPPLTAEAKVGLLESLMHKQLGTVTPSVTAHTVLSAINNATMSKVEGRTQPSHTLLHTARNYVTAYNRQVARATDCSPISQAASSIGVGLSQQALDNLVGPPLSCAHGHARIPCLALHPQVPHSCSANFVRVFYDSATKILPLYSSLTFVPLLIFKNIKILKNPWKYISESTLSIARSCCFLGLFASIYQLVVCTYRKVTPDTSRESKLVLFSAGIICSFLSILCERKSRRSELALYVFPRAFDAVISILREKSLLPGPLLGSFDVENVWVWSASTAVLTYYFVNDPDHLSSLVYTVLKYVTGKDPITLRKQWEEEQLRRKPQASSNDLNVIDDDVSEDVDVDMDKDDVRVGQGELKLAC